MNLNNEEVEDLRYVLEWIKNPRSRLDNEVMSKIDRLYEVVIGEEHSCEASQARY